LYRRDFDGLLASGELLKSVMFFGESLYFIDTYTAKLMEKLPQNSSVLKMYYQDYDHKAALSHLQNGSLFDDANVLIIQTDKKIPKKELDPIIESAAKNETSYFILKYLAPDGKEKSKAFAKKLQADSVRFFAPDLREATGVMRDQASRLGMKISEHALGHILSLNHNNLELSVSELEKLSVLEGEVDIKTIDRIIQGSADIDINDFFDAVLTGGKIGHALELLIERGEDEVRILNLFQSYVVQLMMFTMSAKVNGRIDSKDVLGYKLPPQLEQKRANLAIRLNARHYHKILGALQACELGVKSANEDKKSLLFSTLIKIQTKLV